MIWFGKSFIRFCRSFKLNLKSSGSLVHRHAPRPGLERTMGCVAHSKMQPARGEPTKQNTTNRGGNFGRSVDSALFLAFTR